LATASATAQFFTKHAGDATPLAVPGVLPEEQAARVARSLAPILRLQQDEPFDLLRVVAVIHPDRPIVAYHLLWRDDVALAWVPFGMSTDEEIVWVGYDSTGAPTDLWTYWHHEVLHADWRGKGAVMADVQWGKHGTLPDGTDLSTLPAMRSLGAFYLLAWLLPDMWLGNAVRRGPWCFCHSFARYKTFSREIALSDRLDLIVQSADPQELLYSVFGPYSRKRLWP
jgi:hypothetical protein